MPSTIMSGLLGNQYTTYIFKENETLPPILDAVRRGDIEAFANLMMEKLEYNGESLITLSQLRILDESGYMMDAPTIAAKYNHPKMLSMLYDNRTALVLDEVSFTGAVIEANKPNASPELKAAVEKHPDMIKLHDKQMPEDGAYKSHTATENIENKPDESNEAKSNLTLRGSK